MLKIYTEPRGSWYVAYSFAGGVMTKEYEPTRDRALGAVLIQLVGKGLVRYP